jgi:drug/metabolite transporter (DMT)-like permease
MGDGFAFIGAMLWSAAIISGDRATKFLDSIDLTLISFLASFIVTLIAAIIFEFDDWKFPFCDITNNIVWIVILGFNEAVGFTLCNQSNQLYYDY